MYNKFEVVVRDYFNNSDEADVKSRIPCHHKYSVLLLYLLEIDTYY